MSTYPTKEWLSNIAPAWLKHKFQQQSRRWMRLQGMGREERDLIRLRDTSKYSPQQCVRNGKR